MPIALFTYSQEVLLNIMEESISKGKAIYHDAMSKVSSIFYRGPFH